MTEFRAPTSLGYCEVPCGFVDPTGEAQGHAEGANDVRVARGIRSPLQDLLDHAPTVVRLVGGCGEHEHHRVIRWGVEPRGSITLEHAIHDMDSAGAGLSCCRPDPLSAGGESLS
jgi:hypothetical protein